MKLEVDIISEELIKPSTPTPPHLRRYPLSLIDQITVHIYAPTLYFYRSTDSGSGGEDLDFALAFKNRLRSTLPDVLSHYPQLAGRPNYASSFINCNDAGVPFREARVNSQLADVVQFAQPDDLNRLFPVELDRFNEELMAVQFTEFACGGVAVASCISHKIADAMTLFSLNNNWAAMARGVKDVFKPHMEGAKIFPAKTMSYDTAMTLVRNRVARRFVFEQSKLEAIRAKYAENQATINQIRPSRIESLSAFVYSRFIAALKHGSAMSNDVSFLINYTVNLRPKMNPPLPHDAFGNYYFNVMIFPSPEMLNTDENCYGLVKQLREETNKINGEMAKKFLNENKDLMETVKDFASKVVNGEIISCAFSSTCRLPLYDVDFGWGRPVWVTFPGLWFKNLVAFLESKDGDGIDAIVHLEEQYMNKLEADEVFLKYAATIPTPSSPLA
ncbi:stemmadenine O-acetyltransferase-like [Benincasa hispida]|uniref:stemmadenine O-acetyltransferase-like n=1 Tax=Benincasa hispida TaxID=102211 RepID=UPI0018FFBB91|nr:stemmadenine O-acetyltransferase-like [Benincasa hispida]